MAKSEKLLTRIAFGRSRQVRVETNDPDIYGRWANGIAARYDRDNHAIVLYPVEKGGSHFHVHGEVHLISILVETEESFTGITPFRITKAAEVDTDDQDEIWIYPPKTLKQPITRGNVERDNSAGRQAHPRSPLTLEDMLEMDEQIDYSHFDPKVFNQLLRMTKEYAAEHDVHICVDEHGEVYGRIDGQ